MDEAKIRWCHFHPAWSSKKKTDRHDTGVLILLYTTEHRLHTQKAAAMLRMSDASVTGNQILCNNPSASSPWIGSR